MTRRRAIQLSAGVLAVATYRGGRSQADAATTAVRSNYEVLYLAAACDLGNPLDRKDLAAASLRFEDRMRSVPGAMRAEADSHLTAVVGLRSSRTRRRLRDMAPDEAHALLRDSLWQVPQNDAERQRVAVVAAALTLLPWPCDLRPDATPVFATVTP